VKICLKELRETWTWLEIIRRKQLINSPELPFILGECDELIAIFVSSTKTADGNK
jgi:four helix bundle protein